MRMKLVGAALALTLGLVACGGGEEPQDGPGKGKDAAGQKGATAGGDWKARGQDAARRGVAFLLEACDEQGLYRFQPDKDPDVGITAIATAAVLANGDEAARARAKPALDWLVSQQKDDGSIHAGQLASYCTAASIMAFKLSGDPAYRQAMAEGARYLSSAQIDDLDGVSRESDHYGGFGYKEGNLNANLSSTQWVIEAADMAGVEDPEFFKKALVFLNRVQNRSESNDRTHEEGGRKVEPGEDGGAIYQPWASKAGLEELPGGRLAFRSYGSMSYALLKCFMLCDLDPKDGRVRALLGWLGRNWRLDRNPGMEHAEGENSQWMGLYYYYLTIGRSLAVAEEKKVALPEALAKWRPELVEKLCATQREDGSWINEQDRWWEGHPALVTAYSLLALDKALP